MRLATRSCLLPLFLIASAAAPAAARDAGGIDADEIEGRVRLEVAERFAAEGRASDALRELELLIRRLPATAAAARARARRAELIAARELARQRPESGRWELVIGDSLLGVAYGELTAWAISEDPSEDAVIWSAVGGGALGLAGSTLATRDRFVGEGFSHLHLYSQILGGWHAFAIHQSADDLAGDDDLDGPDGDDRVLPGLMVAAGLTGLGASVLLRDRLEMSRGEAEIITSAWGWGLWLGAMGSVIAQEDPDGAASVLIPMLVASDVGLVAGALLAPRLRWGRWHGRLINLGGFLGGLLGGAVLLTADAEDGRVIAGTLAAGSLAGAGLAAFLTRDLDAGGEGASGPVPALVQVGARGATLGTPLPRPIVTRAADGRPGVGAVADLVGGVF